ncbi:MAG: hypothetical protein ROO71_03925 [Balneola sp.]
MQLIRNYFVVVTRRAIELLDAAQAPNALKINPGFERLGFLFFHPVFIDL